MRHGQEGLPPWNVEAMKHFATRFTVIGSLDASMPAVSAGFASRRAEPRASSSKLRDISEALTAHSAY